MQKLVLLVTLLVIHHAFSQKQEFDIVFKNVNIVSMENVKPLLNQNIAIKNGKIIAIENAKKSKLKAIKTIDLKGKYILPSLADAHIHLPEKEEDLKRFFELNLLHGVTKLRSMRGDWKHLAWKEKYNSKDSQFPKLYLSAPPISRSLEATPEELEAFVKKSKESGFGFLKILSLKNQDVFVQLDNLSKKYDIPLAGHFPYLSAGVSIDEELFLKSNFNSLEHLGGLIGDPKFFESRLQAIKKNNIFICPTLTWYSIGSGQYSYDELQKLAGMEYVSKATMQTWLEKTKQYRYKMGEQALKEEVAKELNDLEEKYKVINRLQKEGIKMLLSPDASSKYMMVGSNIISEIELLKKAKLSNFEILQMATTNFAQFFNENYGVLKTGNDADFIVLDENPIDNLQTLKNVKGLYFNSFYLSSEKLMEIKANLLSVE
ncbi:amidohydrolase family protein [Flavobacterium sp.]|jgi:hypothetical protein|uniref:amidohydrolase family protein n=1 Tax=Flavobacterium sp. TaxID=239 RepID=UPI0037C18AF7